jgi:hypothetical protein
MEDRKMGFDRLLYNFARKGILPSLQGSRVGSGSVIVDSSGALKPLSVGKTYFVADNYGDDDNDGSSWDKALKTFAAAVTLSNASIAANKYGWDARNTIYISGGPFVETLVAFPSKCDVIGVGSYNANDMPGITGNHAPVNAGNYGTRFFNVFFHGAAVAGPIITLASSSSGIKFIDCIFDAPVSGTTNTRAILATASPFLVVAGCIFKGPFSADYITFGTGEAGGTMILDNIMQDGADNGIMIGAGTTASWRGLIRGNFIQCADKFLDTQATSVFNIVDNTCISGEALGSSSYVIDLTYAVGNRVTGNDVSATIPVIPAT